MTRNELRILIVEDDPTFAKAIVQAVQNEGYQVTHANKAPDALAQFKLQEFHAVIIDCLLPGTSGLDLAVQIRQSETQKTPILFMSGVFKDKTYIRDAQAKVHAVAFFIKPFDIKLLLQQLDTCLETLIDEPLEPLQKLISNPTSSAEKAQILKSTTQCVGYDLPRLLFLIIETKLQGELQLTGTDAGLDATLEFRVGKIERVNMKDPQSFFGALLVEKNFLSPEELDLVLKKPSAKRIGERLVEENLISPHTIDLVTAEQMAIRLSRLINDQIYNLAWQEKEIQTSNASIDQKMFVFSLYDWIQSKIPAAWLKAFYRLWLGHGFVPDTDLTKAHPAFNYANFQRFAFLKDAFFSQQSLQNTLSGHAEQEEDLINLIHFLITQNLLYLQKAESSINYLSQAKRLEKIFIEMQNQDHFQVLGLTVKSKQSEVQKIYHELAKVFHPDKLDPRSPPDVKELTLKVFARMTKAYEVLSNTTLRESYIQDIRRGQADLLLAAESKLEEAKKMLNLRQFAKATDLLQKTMQTIPVKPEFLLHLAWGKLGQAEANPNKQIVLGEVEGMLNKIPPEDRHSPLFYFVKGLWQKYQGQFELAENNFKHAVSLQPDFIEAKRELQLKNLQDKESKVDLLHGDLSQVVSQIFKKKK